MEQDKAINEPDAIVVLASGIKQDVSGRWVSTDLTAEDDALGAPGGKLRIHAAAVLANLHHPMAIVVTGGAKGFDVPKDAPLDRPLLAEILRDELIECGIPEERIVLEEKSNTTYQHLQELERIIRERQWRNILIVTSRYHLPRLRAMFEAKFPALVDRATLVSAEGILIKVDPARWEKVIAEAYASSFMAERMEKEEQGTAQIKNGSYQFR